MGDILDRVVNEYKVRCEWANNPILTKMTYEKCANFISASNLPIRYLQDTRVDMSRASRKLLELNNNISDYIFGDEGVGVFVKSCKNSGYLISRLLETHLVNKAITDDYAGNVLYVNTPIFLDDYKKLFTKNADTISPRPNYSLEVLYHSIYDADFVFWDKFTMVDGNFEINKLYEILSIRYDNCLNNMFILDGISYKDLCNFFTVELMEVMNIENNVYDIQLEDIPIKKGE